MRMKSLTYSAALLGVLMIPGGAGATVCFTGCTASGEQKIFFSKDASSSLDAGHIGSKTGTVFEFQDPIPQKLDFFADGFATIKPAKGIGSFNQLNVFEPGHTFTDLDFSAQLSNTGAKSASFDVFVYGPGLTLLASNTYTAKPDANKDYLITSTDLISRIVFKSLGGFKQMKQFQVSGAAVAATPVPATLPLFAAGLGVLVLSACRRTRRRRKYEES